MIRKSQRFYKIMQVSFDALTLLFAYVAAVLIKSPVVKFDDANSTYAFDALWMVPLLLFCYYLSGVYSPMRSWLFRTETLLVGKAHFAGIVSIFSVFFLADELLYSRQVALAFAALGLVLVLAQRYGVRKTLGFLRRKGVNRKHILVIGAGPLGVDFARKARAHTYYGFTVVGFLDDDLRPNETVAGLKVLGGCAALPGFLVNHAVDEVVVALPLSAYGRHAGIVQACEKAGVRIRIIPDYHQFLPSGTPQIEEFDGIPLLNVRRIPLDDPLLSLSKRALDVMVSAVALVVSAPLMMLIALGIKLTSPGPLLFRQQRVGLNNHTFDMLKFRSMHVATDSSASTVWTTANDPRKTRFGAFLRKTSLDELPQFFNVLRGDMSVIGPRPERPFFVEQFKEEIPQYMVKHQVKPGITGWAQVNGWRGDTSIKKRIECDIYYIENWKMVLDIKIMFLTFFKGLVNKNAY